MPLYYFKNTRKSTTGVTLEIHRNGETPHLNDGRGLLFLEKQFHVGVGHVEDDRLALGPRR